jgi:hypothetical protein
MRGANAGQKRGPAPKENAARKPSALRRSGSFRGAEAKAVERRKAPRVPPKAGAALPLPARLVALRPLAPEQA